MITGTLFKKLFGRVGKASPRAQRMVSTYVWIDLEMTGLDPTKDRILEIACILTNTELQYLHEGISYIIHQPNHVLDAMNDWCIEHHGKSGLTNACRNSKISLSEAEQKVVDYIKRHAPQGTKYLAGNSVYMDRLFLMKYMPSIHNLFHYRLLDVSSVKLLCSDWYPEVFSNLPEKKFNHRALDDIICGIEELRNYRKSIFK